MSIFFHTIKTLSIPNKRNYAIKNGSFSNRLLFVNFIKSTPFGIFSVQKFKHFNNRSFRKKIPTLCLYEKSYLQITFLKYVHPKKFVGNTIKVGVNSTNRNRRKKQQLNFSIINPEIKQ